ncbi:MAG: endonuclease/exonuclease/phosphatase family protein [Eggerthellaceae bacterium]
MEPKPRHAAHAAPSNSQNPGELSEGKEPRDFSRDLETQDSPEGPAWEDLQEDLDDWGAPAFQQAPAQGAYVRPVNTADVRRNGRKPKSRKKAVPSNGSPAVRSAKAHKRKRNPFGVIFRILASLLAIAAIIVVIGGGALAIAEFRPRDVETVQPAGSAAESVQAGSQISLLTWNIGYGGLSASASSFTDGGEGVRAQSQEAVRSSISSAKSLIEEQSADIVFLQEVDRASSRSFGIDQETFFSDPLEAAGYSCAFAQDYRVLYVPYPWPCLGEVDSGMITASRFAADSTERIALPKDDSLVRDLIAPEPCYLVSRIPVEGSRKELVVANVRFSDRVSQEVQDKQTADLALFVKRESDKGNYVIVGGDFDQNFSGTDVRYWGKEVSQVRSTGVIDEGTFPEGTRFAMDPAVATARSLNAPLESPDVRFYVSDGFILSANVQLDKVQTIDAGFQQSDHNPVRLEVTLK